MRLRRVLALGPFLALPVSRVAAQQSAGAIAAFRGGLEISADGSSWARRRIVPLSESRCARAASSPCAPGTAPLVLGIRFPKLPNAVDGAKVLSQLGESGSKTMRYFVRPVPANAASSICGGGFAVSNPLPDMRVTINLGNPGAPLPVTCRWTAVAGVPDTASPLGFDMVWSDTVVVEVISKP